MKIRVNNSEYNNIQWQIQDDIGRLTLVTDDSVLTVLRNFAENNELEIYDENDILISKWYNAEILSATEIRQKGESRKVEVWFRVQLLENNTQEVIENNISDSIDGVLELAALLNNLEEEHAETRRRTDSYITTAQQMDKNFNAKSQAIDEKIQEQNQFILQLREQLEATRDQVTVCNNAIQDIPRDIVIIINRMQEAYNDLADRIARLENGDD